MINQQMNGELLTILNQLPAAIEKAFYDAMVLRHPGHGSQKVHNPHKHGGKLNEFESVATRMNSAENRFIAAVKEQFGKTDEEAEIILTVFKKNKVLKIDPVMGQFKLTHGAFWDKQVMNNALDMAKKKGK